MSTEVSVSARPFDLSPLGTEKRPILLAAATGPACRQTDQPRAWGHALRLALATEIGSGERLRHIHKPEHFWNWAQRTNLTGRKLLVLCDPNRDLAMLGIPEGYRWRAGADDAECACDGIVMPSPLNLGRLFIGKLDRESGRGGFDIVGLSNFHPAGVDTNQVPMSEAVAWVEAWVALALTEPMGSKLAHTPPMQAMRSLRATWIAEDRFAPPLRERDKSGEYVRGADGEILLKPSTSTFDLCWHDDADLAAFEHQVMAAQSPVRFGPTNAGPFPKLYHFDFTAHYLSIMAGRRLPTRPLFWCPQGCSIDRFRHLIERRDVCLLGDVSPFGGGQGDGMPSVLLTTPDLLRHAGEIGEVRRLAVYKAGTPFADWARHMFAMRSEVDPLIAGMVKRIGVSLWGYLSRHNRSAEIDDDPDYADNVNLWGAGRIWDDRENIGIEYDAEGNCCITDPAGGSQRERYRALGAHMIAYGARATQDLAGELKAGEVIASHTDSVWATKPIPGTSPTMGHRKAELGGITCEVMRNVEWRNGNRYIGGRLDAAPGMRRAGTVTYLPFDDPAQTPGQALYEVQQ